MRPQQLAAFLERAFQNRRKILLKGPPGVGKTQISEQVLAKLGYDIIVSNPPVEDPTVASGFPFGKINDKGVLVADFAPFGNLRRAMEATRPTCWILEDFGQASVAVQAAYMNLLSSRRVNGHILPDNVFFFATTNDTGQFSGVVGLIEPVKSRFDSIIEAEVSVDDWCLWALDHVMPAEEIGFIRGRPDLLFDFKPTKELKNSPSPRTWEAFGNLYNDGERELEVFAGAVGKGAAAEFVAFLELLNGLPNLDQILLNPASAMVPDKASLRYAVVTGLAHKANQNNLDAAMAYAARLPKPFEVLFVKDATRRTPKLTQTNEFTRWACNKENREAVL